MAWHCGEGNMIALFESKNKANGDEILLRLQDFYPDIVWNGEQYPFTEISLFRDMHVSIYDCNERSHGRFRMMYGGEVSSNIRKMIKDGNLITDVDEFLSKYFGASNHDCDFELEEDISCLF